MSIHGINTDPVFISVQGHCPSCGRTTLMVNPKGGDIFCSYETCRRPDAASAILYDGQETGHLVTVKKDGFWTAKHPLIERLDDALLTCRIGDYIQQQRAWINPGIYRITSLDGQWFRERIS